MNLLRSFQEPRDVTWKGAAMINIWDGPVEHLLIGNAGCFLFSLFFLLQATEAMVTSVVLNDDVVPRMSAQSIEVLADQVRCGTVWCGGDR